MKSFSRPNPFLAIILQLLTQFNFSAPKLISWQAGVSKLDSILLSWTPLYNHFAWTMQKTQPLYYWEGVFTATLPSNSCPIVALVGSRRNAFTKSLPSNGYTCHNMTNLEHWLQRGVKTSTCSLNEDSWPIFTNFKFNGFRSANDGNKYTCIWEKTERLMKALMSMLIFPINQHLFVFFSFLYTNHHSFRV
jgi:hypothetical protein